MAGLTSTTPQVFRIDDKFALGVGGGRKDVFLVTPSPAPTVTSITPSSGIIDTTVNITNLAGTGFHAGATVKITKGAATIDGGSVSVVSATKITCTLDLSSAATGDWDLTVTNTDAQYGILESGFTVTNPAPTITSITPDSGVVDTSVNIMDLAGTNFYATATVKLRKGAATITASAVNCVTTTQITCTLDLTGAALGFWDVVVGTPGYPDYATLGDGFEVREAYAATALSPNEGHLGDTIHVLGYGFGTYQAGSVVKFGGITAPITAWSSTDITCTVPMSLTDDCDVVLTVDGEDSAPLAFNLLPTITNVAPSSGAVGDKIVFTGVEFGAAPGVIVLNGVVMTVTSWSDTSITAIVPNTTTGDIIVEDSGGDLSDPWPFGVRTNTILRFIEDDYQTVRLEVSDPANGYWLADFNPSAPEPVEEEVDPDDQDGQYQVEDSRTYNNITITITLHIQGTSPSDLMDKFKAIQAEITRRNLLEYRPPGWADSRVYTTFPFKGFDPKEMYRTAIIENNRATGVVIELAALPFSEAPGNPDELAIDDYIVGDAPAAIMVLVVPPGEVLGDIPAPMDIYVTPDDGAAPFSHLQIGQRKLYHASFNPIAEPTTGTLVALANRLNGDYQNYAIAANLITDDPGFEEYDGSGNTATWDHWDEHRSSNADLKPTTSKKYEGSAAVFALGPTTYNTTIDIHLTTKALYAVDAALEHWLGAMVTAAPTQFSNSARFKLQALCYDATPTLLDTLTLVSRVIQFPKLPLYGAFGGTSGFSFWHMVGGYISAIGDGGIEFPTGTTQVKVRLRQYGLGARGQVQYWDYVVLAPSVRVGECSFDLESHRGLYLPQAGIRISDGITAYDELMLKAKVGWTGEEAVTAGYEQQSVAKIGNPDGAFVDIGISTERFARLSVPTQLTPGPATAARQDLVLELNPLFDNTRDVGVDYLGLGIPCDRAFVEVQNWEASYMIIDSRSEKQAVLTSVDGTIEKAKVFDPQNWKPRPKFWADPAGMNMVIKMIYDDDGDHLADRLADFTFKYRRRYRIASDG